MYALRARGPDKALRQRSCCCPGVLRMRSPVAPNCKPEPLSSIADICHSIVWRRRACSGLDVDQTVMNGDGIRPAVGTVPRGRSWPSSST